MCGIAGILRYNNKSNIDAGLLTKMLSAIRHRGPDESGVYIDDYIGIGHVRLSIIDLVTGQQPMSNQRNNLWIVFNGEIFNFIELKQELIQLGYHFKTTSDTEVLLCLYEEFGTSCLNKLNGQFAFAIWDTQKQELFIARDRVGIRPLFYCSTANTFVFASEVKAILEHPEVISEIEFKAVSQLFTFWTVLPGYSPFKNIRELEPGHYLIVKGQNIRIEKYWDLSFCNPGNYITNSLGEAMDGFRSVLFDSVKLRLRSDVPVAAYLSGGLDSSTITAFIKQISPQYLQTFSIGFAAVDYDETLYQHEVSTYLNTQHISFQCTSSDIAEVFPEVVWYCESPVFRTAPAPMYLLSKKVRENNVKVVMTGEGADEILAGYDIFKELQIREFWAKQPNSKIRPLLLKKLYPYIPQINSMSAQILKFVFGYRLDDTNHPFYAFLLRWNKGSFICKYFSAEVINLLKGYNPMDEIEQLIPNDYHQWDSLSKAQWVESKLLMSNYILSSQGDRMAMANSIEGRYPFLDYRVIEYASKLPPTFKMRGLNEKYLLKKMMANQLPESVLQRNKQAYRAPITSAFFSEKPPDYVQYYLSRKIISEYNLFNPDLVEQLIKRLQTDKNASENDTMALTAILSTQLFYSMYIIQTNRPVSYNHLLTPIIIEKQIINNKLYDKIS